MDMDESNVYEQLAQASSPDEVKSALSRCGCKLTRGGDAMENPQATVSMGKNDPEGKGKEEYPESHPEMDDEYGAGKPRRGAVISIIVKKMKGGDEDGDD